MQLINNFHKGFRKIDKKGKINLSINLKKSLKDKKGITFTNTFQKIFNESNRKPNKIRIDKGSEFCYKMVRR